MLVKNLLDPETSNSWKESKCSQTVLILSYPSKAPFRAEAPLLLELLTLIFEGIAVSDLLQAAPAPSPSAAAHKPRQVHDKPCSQPPMRIMMG